MFGSATGGSETVPHDTSVIRFMKCQVYGHALAQCRVVVQLREAPNPPLYIYFRCWSPNPPLYIYFHAGKLPPGYYYNDYSCPHKKSTALASLPTQQWVVDRQKRQRQQWLDQEEQ